MASTFLNLLRYARSTEIEATENFTIEALAACIRSDPGPVLSLLERLSLIGSAGEVAEVVALTQVMQVGAGIIDLVLQLRLPDRLMEVWVEVKVAAGESGNQIDNYRRFIESQPDGLRPQLVTLSRWPIRPDPDLTWLSWQAVRAQALTSAEPYWRDLAAFLEDIDMADEFDAPVTSREAASLADAARLLGKTRRILLPVFDQARRDWPEVAWPASEEDVRKNLAVWYRDLGSYTSQIGDYSRKGTWLVIGIWPAEGEAELGISVMTDPKFLPGRSALLSLADTGGLPATWGRHMAGREALKIRERLVSFPDHAAARTWLSDRLGELGAAGALLPMLAIPTE